MVYIGDIRADEGLRIRADNICPCLHGVRGGYLTNVPVIIEVNEDGMETDSDTRREE